MYPVAYRWCLLHRLFLVSFTPAFLVSFTPLLIGIFYSVLFQQVERQFRKLEANNNITDKSTAHILLRLFRIAPASTGPRCAWPARFGRFGQ